VCLPNSTIRAVIKTIRQIYSANILHHNQKT
jgi:hypothetical protein